MNLVALNQTTTTVSVQQGGTKTTSQVGGGTKAIEGERCGKREGTLTSSTT